MGQQYNQALAGELDPTTLSEAMKLEFEQVQTDIAEPRTDPSSWATRMARLDAALLLDAADYNEVRSDPVVSRVLPNELAWPSLEKMEEETFLQIITGAAPVDAFDTFAEQWYASGGAALLEKLNQP
jgi:putative aldouronate transport system substrate-binding protein